MNLPTTNKSYNIMAYMTILNLQKETSAHGKNERYCPEYNSILKSKTGKIEVKARATTRVDTSAFLK